MSNIQKIEFPSLLDELVQYGNKVVMEVKVNRVHYKCIKAGKISLANKIAIKYRMFMYKSDMVKAMEWSLWALAKNKNV